MQISWNDTDPIYRQLFDRMIELMLDGIFTDGDALPSVRQIASDHRINPITVSKAYQMLVDDGLVEKRRGLGMFVVDGAAARLATVERTKFLTEEWPRVCVKIERLGLSTTELLAQSIQSAQSAHSTKEGDPS
ncbi:MAG: GntR family transcriptional regulator [Cyclobacteriaceae bacterium]|jgi:GntR family transcriptional regulator